MQRYQCPIQNGSFVWSSIELDVSKNVMQGTLILIILIIHIIVSFDQNISLIYFMWKMDPMSGFYIRRVYITAQRQYTAVQKMRTPLK